MLRTDKTIAVLRVSVFQFQRSASASSQWVPEAEVMAELFRLSAAA
jgi:hypothetical protein